MCPRSTRATPDRWYSRLQVWKDSRCPWAAAMVERMYGKAELAGDAGLFRVKPRTPHVWRDRDELPPPDNHGFPVNGSAVWARGTLLLWAVQTGRVELLRDPADRADARLFHVKRSTQTGAS